MKTNVITVLMIIFMVATPARAGFVHIAVDNNDFETLETLLQSGYDVDEKDEDGATPLFYATENLNLEICELLLKKGANANATDKLGNTPLHRLIKSSVTPEYETPKDGMDAVYMRIIKLLMRYKADFNIKNKLGRNPLYLAIKKKLPLTVKYLMERGAYKLNITREETVWLLKETSDEIQTYVWNVTRYFVNRTLPDNALESPAMYLPFSALMNNINDINYCCTAKGKPQLLTFIKEIDFKNSSYNGLQSLIFLDRSNKRKQKETVLETVYENNYLGLKPYKEMALQCKLGDSLEKRYPQFNDVRLKIEGTPECVYTLETKRKLETI